jgi:hypothetical protein
VQTVALLQATYINFVGNTKTAVFEAEFEYFGVKIIRWNRQF